MKLDPQGPKWHVKLIDVGEVGSSCLRYVQIDDFKITRAYYWVCKTPVGTLHKCRLHRPSWSCYMSLSGATGVLEKSLLGRGAKLATRSPWQWGGDSAVQAPQSPEAPCSIAWPPTGQQFLGGGESRSAQDLHDISRPEKASEAACGLAGWSVGGGLRIRLRFQLTLVFLQGVCMRVKKMKVPAGFLVTCLG